VHSKPIGEGFQGVKGGAGEYSQMSLAQNENCTQWEGHGNKEGRTEKKMGAFTTHHQHISGGKGGDNKKGPYDMMRGVGGGTATHPKRQNIFESPLCGRKKGVFLGEKHTLGKSAKEMKKKRRGCTCHGNGLWIRKSMHISSWEIKTLWGGTSVGEGGEVSRKKIGGVSKGNFLNPTTYE